MEEEKLNEENIDTVIPEDIENSEDSSGLLTGSQYDLPKDADAFVDAKDGKVINKEDLTPFEMIKAIAQQTNTIIRNPKKDCKKCYGRGYSGIESKTRMPIPCNCIYPPRPESTKENEKAYDSNKVNNKMNHYVRRKMKLSLKRDFKKYINRSKDKPEEVELSEQEVNDFLVKYIELSSIKKTARHFGYTETKVKKILAKYKDKVIELKGNNNV